jgi:Phosphotransacetylase
MIQEIKGSGERVRVAVAAAQDEYVLKAVYNAFEIGIIDAVLVGNEPEINHICEKLGIPEGVFEVINVPGDHAEQCRVALELVLDKKAQLIMKGVCETSVILKEMLSKKESLMENERLSHVAVFEVPTYHKLLFMSDSAMIIAPTLHEKRILIENALSVTKAFGIREAKVATLCAKESVSMKMPATIDADELSKMNREGVIKDCILSGPMAMDVAVSHEAAKHKGIENPVAGEADILIMPSIEAGNIAYKLLTQFAGAKSGGIVMGARVPIILTSRSDNEESKLYAIALAVFIMLKGKD